MINDFILKNFSDDTAFDEKHQEQLLSVLIQRPFKRGEILIKAGEQARYMLFVNAGYLMTTYSDTNGSDHVISLLVLAGGLVIFLALLTNNLRLIILKR